MKYISCNRIIVALLLVVTVLALPECGRNSTPDIEADLHAGHDHGPGGHLESPASAASDRASENDWCLEHSVPESECTRCEPELIDRFKDSGDWCGGHNLPESHCRLCNPDIRFPQEATLMKQALESVQSEINVSLFHRSNAAICATNDALIQFASPRTGDRAGITVESARASSRISTIEAPAEITFAETHSAVVSSTVPALVSRWLMAPGDAVRRGDILAITRSPEIAELEARLLAAHAAAQAAERETQRHEQLKSRNLISDSDYEVQIAAAEQTRAEFESVKGLLVSAGLSSDDVDQVLNHREVSNQFALRAPADGVIVERRAQLGELLAAGGAFAIIADPASMWIEARLTEEQLRRVEIGQELTFTSDGYGLARVGGRVIWVSRFLDPHTRTGIARAEIATIQHALQAGEFGRVTITSRVDEQVTLVPKDAVQWEGCCNVVFVRENEGTYRPRKVELLEGNGVYYQVNGQVRPGEDVVVGGAFLLKTELVKSSIGAGCCGIEPVG